jgi:3-hydroxyethyl bacteriochlorophyllide a dehydrogenase
MEHTAAVVISAVNTVAIQEVSLTALAPHEVAVQTIYTSISAGTERMLMAGQMPHPMLQFPVIPGYETVGRICAAGSEVPNGLIGQTVYVGGARCYEGVNPAWGGQARRLHIDHRRVIPLDGVEPAHGVLLALAATAMHGVDVAGELHGKRLLVIGQGPVGQLAARIAMLRGAEVSVVDKNPLRLTHAQATTRYDVSVVPLSEQTNTPYDIIIEASGSMQALQSCLVRLAPNSVIVLLGYYDEIRIPYMPLFLAQAKVLTAKEWAPGELVRCRDLIASGELNVGTLLTHTGSISDIQAAYDIALHDERCLKLLLTWPSA